MKYKVTIEIPKGSTRRIHMSYDKTGFIDLGPIRDQIPINDGIMPVAYGYINGTINKEEKDEVDALLFSSKAYKTGEILDVDIIGMFVRADEDHKVITTDSTLITHDFSELSSEERDLITQYFGHKAKIISIDSREKATEYVQSCLN